MCFTCTKIRPEYEGILNYLGFKYLFVDYFIIYYNAHNHDPKTKNAERNWASLGKVWKYKLFLGVVYSRALIESA